MIEIISSLVCNLLALAIILLVISSISKNLQHSTVTFTLVCLGSFCLINTITDYFVDSYGLFTVLNTVYIFLVIKILFKTSLSETMIYLALADIIIFLIELPVALITFPLNKMLSQDIYNIIGTLITFLLYILLFRRIPLSRYYSKIKEDRPFLLIILINLALIVFFISIYFKAQSGSFYQSALIIFIAYIIIIAININLFVTRAKIERQKLIISAQNDKLKMYENYLPAISDLITDVRERQHNYNDKLDTIYSLPVIFHDYDSLSNALRKECLSKVFSSISSSLLKLELKVVAAFLFSKYNQAKREGKSLDISLPSNKYSSTVPEYILVEMLSILINNALEATPEGKTVFVKLDCNDDSFGAEIKNPGTPFNEEQKKEIFRTGYTTKDEDKQHGFGLSGLKKLADQYNCDIIVTDDEKDGESFIVFRIITDA